MITEVKIFIDGKEMNFATTESATTYLMRYNEAVKKQNEFVIARLETFGKISRNFALSNFITRLSARIANIKEKGFEVVGAWDAEHKDYVYTLIKKGSC